jgi:hypothetical protein
MTKTKKSKSLVELASEYKSFTEPNSGVPAGKSKPVIRPGLEAVFTSRFRRKTQTWVCGVTLLREHCPVSMAKRIIARTPSGHKAGTHAAWCLKCDTLSPSTSSRKTAIDLCKTSHVWCEKCAAEQNAE